MFQFINKETKQIYTLNEIDEICANFWGVKMHPKYYAQPKTFGPNWFDVLGRAVEDCQFFKHLSFKINTNNDKCFDFDTISSMILFHLTQYEETAEGKMEQATQLKPYIELCYHLKNLGIVGSGLGW